MVLKPRNARSRAIPAPVAPPPMTRISVWSFRIGWMNICNGDPVTSLGFGMVQCGIDGAQQSLGSFSVFGIGCHAQLNRYNAQRLVAMINIHLFAGLAKLLGAPGGIVE